MSLADSYIGLRAQGDRERRSRRGRSRGTDQSAVSRLLEQDIPRDELEDDELFRANTRARAEENADRAQAGSDFVARAIPFGMGHVSRPLGEAFGDPASRTRIGENLGEFGDDLSALGREAWRATPRSFPTQEEWQEALSLAGEDFSGAPRAAQAALGQLSSAVGEIPDTLERTFPRGPQSYGPAVSSSPRWEPELAARPAPERALGLGQAMAESQDDGAGVEGTMNELASAVARAAPGVAGELGREMTFGPGEDTRRLLREQQIEEQMAEAGLGTPGLVDELVDERLRRTGWHTLNVGMAPFDAPLIARGLGASAPRIGARQAAGEAPLQARRLGEPAAPVSTVDAPAQATAPRLGDDVLEGLEPDGSEWVDAYRGMEGGGFSNVRSRFDQPAPTRAGSAGQPPAEELPLLHEPRRNEGASQSGQWVDAYHGGPSGIDQFRPNSFFSTTEDLAGYYARSPNARFDPIENGQVYQVRINTEGFPTISAADDAYGVDATEAARRMIRDGAPGVRITDLPDGPGLRTAEDQYIVGDVSRIQRREGSGSAGRAEELPPLPEPARRGGSDTPAIAGPAALGTGAYVALGDEAEAQEQDSPELAAAKAEFERADAATRITEGIDRSDPAAIERMQERLQELGAYGDGGRFRPDGQWAGGTDRAVEKFNSEIRPRLEAERDRARATLDTLTRDEVARRNEAPGWQQALREHGPTAALLAGYGIGHRSRLGAVAQNAERVAARNAQADAIIARTRGADPQGRMEALNEYWQTGGARRRVPYKAAPGTDRGFEPRLGAAETSEIFRPKGVLGIGGNDAAFLAAFGGESVASSIWLHYAQQELEAARAAAIEDPNSDDARKRLEAALDQVAWARGLENIGRGAATGRLSGALRHPYSNARPASITRAGAMRARLDRPPAPPKPRAQRSPPPPPPPAPRRRRRSAQEE